MTRISNGVLGVLGVLTAAGCSGGTSEQLDCAWLDGENCWKTAVASVTATCLPPAAQTGLLSADNKTCTYGSGETIAFTPALTLPRGTGPASFTWSFTISKGGVECLHFESTQTTMKLVVGDQTVSEAVTGGSKIGITCPDGITYANPNAIELLSCGADTGASFGGLPGNTHSSTGDSVSFGWLGAVASVQVFNCQR